jgi:hypothetical protein
MSTTWREDPFKIGCEYRVRKSFSAMRDNFLVGEILKYKNSAHSHYDGVSGFIFSDAQNRIRVWDLPDDDSIGVWIELFEEV